MGQAQSEVASAQEIDVDQIQRQLSSSMTPHNSQPATPMKSLIAGR